MIGDSQIRAIVASDVKLLKIYENEQKSEYSWWAVDSFNPAAEGEEAIKFHTVVGYELTDFFASNPIVMSEKEFIIRLTDVIDASRKITCKFHDAIRWKLYVR